MLNQFKDLWQSLGSNQKISLILAGGLVFLSMIGMLIWAAQPQMEILYGKLPPEDLDKIVSKLEQAGVPYEVRGGTAVYVESGQKHKLKADLAKDGIPTGSGPGYELFDTGSFGISELVQRTNLLRAIQGELSRTISMFDGIDSARVLVVMPENRLLASREGRDRPTASVFVESGGIPVGTVNSIRHLVANAIQNLNVNDVVVVDSMGTVLSEELRNDGLGGGLNNEIIRYRKSLESYFTGKVQSMLDKVLGPGMSEVRVAVDVETASVQTTEEKFDPESQVARSTQVSDDSQIERETSGDSLAAVGATSNTPNPAASPGTVSKLVEKEDKNKQTTFNYELNKTVISSVQNPGSIKRLTASLIVAKKVEGTGAETTFLDRSQQELDDISRLVVNALGIELRPGQRPTDYVTVQEMAFAADPYEDHSDMLRQEVNFQRYIEMGKNGLGAILGIGVIIFFLQMLKRHKPEKISIEVLQPEQMLQSKKMEDTSVVTPEMLNELIRQKPANIGVSLREWIGDVEGAKR